MLGSIGFSGGNVFYEALLKDICPEAAYVRVSSLGYLGGGLLFAFNVGMSLRPHWFGLADAGAAVRWSFVAVAV